MKLLALNSGGIDSPVAMHMLLRHGHDMEAVIFDLDPFTAQEDIETAMETVEILEDVHDTEIPVHVVPHGFVQETYLAEIDENNVHYNCLFSRRVMYRTAEELADDIDAGALVTGESLGQVASQTLDNMVVTGSAVDMPVLRPVVGLDKREIVDTAKEIGTYDVSTQGGVQCAANIDYPETHGAVEEMKQIEEQFDVQEMIAEGLKNRSTRMVPDASP